MSSIIKNLTSAAGVLAIVAGAFADTNAFTTTAEQAGPVQTEGAPVAFWLHVLHHADGESQIINAGAGSLADFGGVARFKTLVDNLKAEASTFPADGVEKGYVFVSAGDNFLAGPEFNASLDNGVPFFDSIAMQAFDYTACVIGNHEFDFGPDVFQQFLEGFTGSFPFLSANLDFSGEPGLQNLVNQGRIAKSVVATVGTQKVGIIGLTTTDLPFISTPRNVVASALLPAVQAEVAALQAMVPPVNKIILVSHLQGIAGGEAALIPQLTGVDVVVAGGGGELFADAGDLLVTGDTATGAIPGVTGTGYPRTVNDQGGNPVLLVSTRGDYRYVGRLIIGFDASCNVVTVLPESGPVRVSGIAPDAVTPDAALQASVVDPVAASVAALASTIIGVTEVPLDGRTNSVRSVETNEGNLIADAHLYNAVTRAAQFNLPVADVALQNGGGIRNNSIFPVGNFSELNTFEALPFFNLICVVPNVPPAQFKEILENAVSRVGGSGNGRFAQISGFRFTWDPTGVAQQVDNAGTVLTPGTRVREVILNDGTVVVRNGVVQSTSRNINVATLDFLARGGDQYPFRGLPFTIVGVSYQQSLDNYITQYLGGSITAVQYPAGTSTTNSERRITRLPNSTPVNLILSNWSNNYDYALDEEGHGDTNFDGKVDTRDLLETLGGGPIRVRR